MSKPEKIRRLAAVMFTDIVGYTALMQQNEAQASRLRDRHRQSFEHEHQRFHGDIIQYFGDGSLSVFKSAVEAVECAVAIQQTLRSGPEPVPLRVGLHLGDIVFDGPDIYGDGVNLASRIESLGVAGSVLLSGALNGELKNQGQVRTRSLGFFQLKNIAEAVEVFAVDQSGLVFPAPADLGGKRKEPAKSIAVLPFVNMSSDPENEYFSDGMTEEMINALTKIKNLKVTSRTSSFFFKNKNLPVQQIGRELGVAAILEGSIRLAGKRMRITAQLIDVADDFHFWSETFDRPVDDMFAVQDEISLRIADKLREQLGHFEIDERLVEAPQVPVDAYKRYLKSRFLLLRMRKADLEEGLALLQALLDEQPRFAQAQLGMHLGYTLMGTIGFMPAQEAFARGHAYLEQAIALQPELPECQLHLAWTAFLQHWDLPAAYRHLNAALEQRPVVDFYQSMASTLVAEAKFAAAHRYIDTALEMDPFSAINHHLKGFIFYGQGKLDAALEAFGKARDLQPGFASSTLYRGLTLLAMNRFAEAQNYFETLPDDSSGDILQLGGSTLARAGLGAKAAARQGVEELKNQLSGALTERALLFLLYAHVLLGELETALDYLDKSLELRLPMAVYLFVDPLLLPLRDQARFQAARQRVLGEPAGRATPRRKYKKALLSKKQLAEYRAALEQFMVKQQPFLHPQLSLRDLAESIRLAPNQLSQLLNEGFGQNFAEFVNGYRIEAFKAKAADPALRHLTLLGLAFDSGFNSKTVFNTSFKKATGLTPRAYCAALNRLDDGEKVG